MACRHCGAATQDTDLFCSICGTRLIGLELAWRPDGVVRLNDHVLLRRADELRTPLEFVTENLGRQDVPLAAGYSTDIPDALVKTCLDQLVLVRQVKGQMGGGITLTPQSLILNQEWLAGLDHRTRIQLGCTAPPFHAGRPLELCVYPTLRLQRMTTDLLVHGIDLTGNQDPEFEVELRAEKGRGFVAGLPVLVDSPTWLELCGARVANANLLGNEVLGIDSHASNQSLILRLRVLRNKVIEGTADARRLEFRLRVSLKDEERRDMPAFEESIQVNVRLGPRLELACRVMGHELRVQEAELEVVRGFSNVVTLLMKNVGDTKLLIEEIEFDSSHVGLVVPRGFPLELESGKQEEIGLRIQAEAELLDETADVGVTIRTNEITALAQHRLEFHLHIANAKRNATLIMDFGTTASVAAVSRPNKPAALFPHPSARPGTQYVPTAIYYRSLEEHYIGKEALGVAASEPYAVQQSFKRNLGETEYVGVYIPSISTSKRMTTRSITSHFLKKYLEAIRNEICADFDSVFLTHPVKFTLSQVRILREIVCECLSIEAERVSLVPEPVAGALGLIVDRYRKQVPGTEQVFDVAVFDFGGGTTDISLLRITSQHPKDGTASVGVQLLGLGGDRELGGDDLTIKLADLLQEKVRAQKTGFAWPPKDSVQNRQNEHVIRSVAEEYKVFRAQLDAELGKDWMLKGDLAGTRFKKYQSMHPESAIKGFSRGAKTEQLDIGRTLFDATRNQFALGSVELPIEAAHVLERERLEGCVKRMHTLCDRLRGTAEIPLVIMPIGRSSAYPLVRELLEAQFPPNNSKHKGLVEYCWYSGDQFKECVTRGLLDFSRLQHELGLGQSSLLFSTRSIGVFKKLTLEMHELVRIGDPLPSNIYDAVWKPCPLELGRTLVLHETAESPVCGVREEDCNELGRVDLGEIWSAEELKVGIEVRLVVDMTGRVNCWTRRAQDHNDVREVCLES
jgi:hypothetical protein